MTSSGLYSDYVLPVGGWYEKYEHKWGTSLMPYIHAGSKEKVVADQVQMAGNVTGVEWEHLKNKGDARFTGTGNSGVSIGNGCDIAARIAGVQSSIRKEKGIARTDYRLWGTS